MIYSILSIAYSGFTLHGIENSYTRTCEKTVEKIATKVIKSDDESCKPLIRVLLFFYAAPNLFCYVALSKLLGQDNVAIGINSILYITAFVGIASQKDYRALSNKLFNILFATIIIWLIINLFAYYLINSDEELIGLDLVGDRHFQFFFKITSAIGAAIGVVILTTLFFNYLNLLYGNFIVRISRKLASHCLKYSLNAAAIVFYIIDLLMFILPIAIKFSLYIFSMAHF